MHSMPKTGHRQPAYQFTAHYVQMIVISYDLYRSYNNLILQNLKLSCCTFY
jgi:intergrase/recombinase